LTTTLSKLAELSSFVLLKSRLLWDARRVRKCLQLKLGMFAIARSLFFLTPPFPNLLIRFNIHIFRNCQSSLTEILGTVVCLFWNISLVSSKVLFLQKSITHLEIIQISFLSFPFLSFPFLSFPFLSFPPSFLAGKDLNFNANDVIAIRRRIEEEIRATVDCKDALSLFPSFLCLSPLSSSTFLPLDPQATRKVEVYTKKDRRNVHKKLNLKNEKEIINNDQPKVNDNPPNFDKFPLHRAPKLQPEAKKKRKKQRWVIEQNNKSQNNKSQNQRPTFFFPFNSQLLEHYPTARFSQAKKMM